MIRKPNRLGNQNRFGRWLGTAADAATIPLLISSVYRPLFAPTGATATLLVLEQLQRLTASSVLLAILPLPGLVGGDCFRPCGLIASGSCAQAEPICLFIVIRGSSPSVFPTRRRSCDFWANHSPAMP